MESVYLAANRVVDNDIAPASTVPRRALPGGANAQ